MFNQHAKWLKVTRGSAWRGPIARSTTCSSHVWRQDHNGFSHQDPGFIDHVVNKKADVVRVYLPPDANTLLSVADHCLRSRHYVNVIVRGKQPALTVLRRGTAAAAQLRGPASGTGSEASRTPAHPESSSPAPATSDARGARGRVASRASPPDCAVRVVKRSST
jgi:xylulose-5-phosphate/fructose-6-phosphate phosphoketolase